MTISKTPIFRGWKVVRVWELVPGRKHFFSCMLPCGIGTHYLIGKWVYPFADCGKLTVFGSLDEAEKFLSIKSMGSVSLEMHQCEYMPSQDEREYQAYLPVTKNTRGWGYPKDVTEMIDGRFVLTKAPVGTRYADAVNLTK